MRQQPVVPSFGTHKRSGSPGALQLSRVTSKSAAMLLQTIGAVTRHSDSTKGLLVLQAMIEGVGILLTKATAPPPAPPMVDMGPQGMPTAGNTTPHPHPATVTLLQHTATCPPLQCTLHGSAPYEIDHTMRKLRNAAVLSFWLWCR